MSAFTVIVQNQYPTQRLGEVTAGLQFFRQIGSTIGLAVFGTILNSQFAAAMKTNLPAPLQKFAHGQAASRLENPQVLLSPSASDRIHTAFAKLGPQGEQLFRGFMNAVRVSLASAISELFLLAAILAAVGFFVVLFLKEVPLRRTHMTVEEAELLAAEAEAGAAGGETPQGGGAEGGQEPYITGRAEPEAEG
jgi:hypothetical protein